MYNNKCLVEFMKRNEKSIQPINFHHAGMHAMSMQHKKIQSQLRDTDQV